MTTAVRWDPAKEPYHEFAQRRREHLQEDRQRRTEEALFRLALASLTLDRYVFGVEHGMSEADGPWRVHAYVACKECYQNRAGLVDPRTLVATPAIRDELDPANDVLTVGANMLSVIQSMMDHEREHHQKS